MGKDKIKGGFADGMSVEDIAKKHGVKLKDINDQLKKGIKVEMEHVNSKALAREIALDHLYEIPDYYKRLEKMEKEAKKELKSEGITEFARRMRELAGLSEGNQSKSLKTIQEGIESEIVENSNTKNKEEFETHKFEQKTIEEGENDDKLYNLNENTTIILDFLDEDE